MSTITEQSPAVIRKTKAAATLQALKAEKETISRRQKSAQETIERMNGEIVQAQRSDDAATLATLRAGRREAEETLQDFERTLPTVERDIELADGELVMSARACAAECWNAIQAEQVGLLRNITEAVELIVNSINEKETLAHRQQQILAGVVPNADRNPALIRHDLAHAIVTRLQGNPPTGLRTCDWSCMQMTEQGDLR